MCFDGRTVAFIRFLVVGLFMAASAHAEEIPMERAGANTYAVPVSINGSQTYPFLLDTGASYVSIPRSLGEVLIRFGAEIVGTGNAVLADGSKQPNILIIVRELRVGSLVARNVMASFGREDSAPLLGQSFLSRFGSATIDYNRHVLVLGENPRPAIVAAVPQPAPHSGPYIVAGPPACRAETVSYCGAVIPGGGRILACLRMQPAGSLSVSCTAALAALGMRR
jgi:gag-polyprotein putative aspartyl protease